MRYLLRHHGRPSAVADWQSRPYRHPKQQGDERHEYEAEVIADGQELQVIELLGSEPDGAADWSIEQLPGEVAQPDGEPRSRGRCIAWPGSGPESRSPRPDRGAPRARQSGG